MSNYITTHNAEGKAVFSDKTPVKRHVIDRGNITLEYIYTSHIFPADLSSEDDIERYNHDRVNLPAENSTLPPNGFATAIVTIKPGAPLIWHRVMSVDTFYIIEGDMELTMDSGDSRTLHAGDSFVQRATMHTGKNVTPNGGSLKLLGAAIPCNIPVEVGDQRLEEEWL